MTDLVGSVTPVAAVPDPTTEIEDAIKRVQENVVANAAQLITASFAPPPGKWTKTNLRRVGLSGLKAFVTTAVAVAVAKNHALAGSHLTVNAIESTLLAIGIAGGGAALKVGEIFLEDN